MSLSDDEVRFSVEDDGRGFEAAAAAANGPGTGQHARERAARSVANSSSVQSSLQVRSTRSLLGRLMNWGASACQEHVVEDADSTSRSKAGDVKNADRSGRPREGESARSSSTPPPSCNFCCKRRLEPDSRRVFSGTRTTSVALAKAGGHRARIELIARRVPLGAHTLSMLSRAVHMMPPSKRGLTSESPE